MDYFEGSDGTIKVGQLPGFCHIVELGAGRDLSAGQTDVQGGRREQEVLFE
jgi:hypothetical protein